MIMNYGWNNTDEKTEVLGEKYLPGHSVYHSLAWDWTQTSTVRFLAYLRSSCLYVYLCTMNCIAAQMLCITPCRWVEQLTDTPGHISAPLARFLACTEWFSNHLVSSLTAIFHQWSNLVSGEWCAGISGSNECTAIHPVITCHREYTVFCQDWLRTPDFCNRKLHY
jgi:hypothetical protein